MTYASKSLDNSVDGKTADRILFFIKSKGPSATARLAQMLEMTPEAARQQVHKLAAAGLIEGQRQDAAGVGRPRQHWVLTEAGNRRFPDTHAQMTVQLIGSIRQLFGEDGLDKLVAQRESEAARAVPAGLRRRQRAGAAGTVGRDPHRRRLHGAHRGRCAGLAADRGPLPHLRRSAHLPGLLPLRAATVQRDRRSRHHGDPRTACAGRRQPAACTGSRPHETIFAASIRQDCSGQQKAAHVKPVRRLEWQRPRGSAQGAASRACLGRSASRGLLARQKHVVWCRSYARPPWHDNTNSHSCGRGR